MRRFSYSGSLRVYPRRNLGFRKKLRGCHNPYPAPEMQHQQVFITADHSVGFGSQGKREKQVVSGIAAGRFDDHQVCILDSEQMSSTTDQRDKFAT